MRFLLLFVAAVSALAIGIFTLTSVQRYDFQDLRRLPNDQTSYERCISNVEAGDKPSWEACYLQSYEACRGDEYESCLRMLAKAARRFVESRNDGSAEFQELMEFFSHKDRNCRDRVTGVARAQCLVILSGGASYLALAIGG